MNELYELATVVLGCVVVGQYMHIRKQTSLRHKLFFTLHKLAERKWIVEQEGDGFIVFDDEGHRMIGAKFVSEE